MQCPGQDSRYWQFDYIFSVFCPVCGNKLEFFQDDSHRTCKVCSQRIPNPKLDLGCVEHCAFADKCLAEQFPDRRTEEVESQS